MAEVYLALGSNLGDRRKILNEARRLISERVGMINDCSNEYETDPEGFHSIHPFINQVIKVHTELSPDQLLRVTQEIECELGRRRKTDEKGYQDRTCDIDIILYGDLIYESSELKIPHPRFRERGFVLLPLSEIAKNIIDPVTHMSIMELMAKYNG